MLTHGMAKRAAGHCRLRHVLPTLRKITEKLPWEPTKTTGRLFPLIYQNLIKCALREHNGICITVQQFWLWDPTIPSLSYLIRTISLLKKNHLWAGKYFPLNFPLSLSPFPQRCLSMKFQFQQIRFFWQFDTAEMANGLLSAKSLWKALG